LKYILTLLLLIAIFVSAYFFNITKIIIPNQKNPFAKYSSIYDKNTLTIQDIQEAYQKECTRKIIEKKKALEARRIKKKKEKEIALEQAKALAFLQEQKRLSELQASIDEARIIAQKEKQRLKQEKQKQLKEKQRRENAILARVKLSTQEMRVYKGKNLLYIWKVSTAKKGYETPKGDYQPYLIKSMHHSKQYNNAPMPYSIFFKAGYAVHGTKSIRHLGHIASHGCVRLATENAKKLFLLVRKSGIDNSTISIIP